MAVNRPIQTTDPAGTVEIMDAIAASRNVRRLDRVFVERVTRGLVTLATQMEPGALEVAVAEETDLGVLLKAMESETGLKLMAAGDPLVAARIRGLQMKQEILEKAGGALQPREVAELLGMSRQAVGKRRAAGKLLAIRLGPRGYEYPACQFGDDGVLEGLEEVLAALDGDIDPWMRLAFLVNPNASLEGDSPLEALQRGETDSVVRAAKIHGQHGAV